MRAATLALLLALACAVQAQAPRPSKKGGGNTSCTIDTVTSVAFGSYDTDSASAQTSTGELRFSCKPNKTLTVQVTIGPSSVTGSIVDRALRELGGSDQLRYNLFQDQRGTVIWGDGVTGGNPAFVTGSKTFNVEIYGIASPGQQVSEGIYADTLRITILP